MHIITLAQNYSLLKIYIYIYIYIYKSNMILQVGIVLLNLKHLEILRIPIHNDVILSIIIIAVRFINVSFLLQGDILKGRQ